MKIFNIIQNLSLIASIFINAPISRADEVVLHPEISCAGGTLLLGTGAGGYRVEISGERIVAQISNAISQHPDVNLGHGSLLRDVSILKKTSGQTVIVISGNSGYYVNIGGPNWNSNDGTAAFPGVNNGVLGYFVRFSNSEYSNGGWAWSPIPSQLFFFSNCVKL